MSIVVTGFILHRSISLTKVSYHSVSKLLSTAARTVASANNNVISNQSVKKEGLKAKKQGRSDFEAYVSANVSPSDRPLIPQDFLKIVKHTPSSAYLVDPSVTLSIREILQKQQLDLHSTVIEFNPGLGCLTSYLFALGFTNVTVFEESTSLASRLENLWPNLSVIRNKLLKLHACFLADLQDNTSRLDKLIAEIKVSKQSNNLYIFGVLLNLSDIHFIIRSTVDSVVLHSGIYPWRNIVYYLVLSSKTHTVLTATPASGYNLYRAVSVLFQTIFNYECLETFPRHCIIPWETQGVLAKNLSRQGKWSGFDQNIVHLVKLSVNEERVAQIGLQDLPQFSFFVRRNLQSRHTRVIPQLEQWIPNCGPKLIRDGFSIFTEFGELTQLQIFELYCKFISYPGFQESSFQASVRRCESGEEHYEKSEVEEDENHEVEEDEDHEVNPQEDSHLF